MRLVSILFLGLASVAAAGFLPLIHDRPKRDNPFDPAVKPRQLPIVDFPTLTATPTPAPACGGPENANYAGFESGVDSFTAESSTGFTVPPLVAGTPACSGAQALCGTATWTYGGNPVKVAFKRSVASQDWSGRSLAAKAYMPGGLNGTCAKLYLKLGGAFAYAQGPCISSPSADGWVDLSLDVDAAAAAASTSPADVREVGVEFYSDAAGNSEGASITVCLDSLSLMGGPTPTITPTFSASPTVALGTPTHTPTPSPTPTPVPACGGADSGSAFASFESTADGFVADTCCANFVAHSPALSATTFCKGAQSLCSSATLDTSGAFKQLVFKREYGSFQDWSGQELAVWAYFNPDWQQASAQVYIKSTGGFVYSNGPITHPPAAGGWTRVLFDLNGAPNYIDGVTNTAQVREVGLQVYVNQGEGRPDGVLDICIDEFVVQ
jgi:hypothetical protein